MRHQQRRPALLALALLLVLLTPVARASTSTAPTRVIAYEHDATPAGRVTARPIEHVAAAAHQVDGDVTDRTLLPAPHRAGRQVEVGTLPPYPGTTSATARGPPRG